jgi:leader peptidase (prepilin peptidase) / N-methyltransferase
MPDTLRPLVRAAQPKNCALRLRRGQLRWNVWVLVRDSSSMFWMTLYVFALGACIGSFLNVVIARLPAGESIVHPRSRCPSCKQPIAWYDNVPLLSFLILRARCRRCRAPIASRYFVVELLTACIYTACWLRFGLSYELCLWLPLSAALMAIVFLDIDHWWVPDVIVFPSMVLALAASFLPDRLPPLVALAGVLPALFVRGIAWVFALITKKEGLGLGDVKLLALIGIAVGPIAGLSVLLLAAVQGSLIGILVVLTGGHQSVEQPRAADLETDQEEWVPPPRAIPFGPFLVLGALEVVLLPDIFAEVPQLVTGLLLRWVS